MARAPIDARSDRADPHQTPCPGIARGRPLGTLIHTSWSLSAIELAVCSALGALITHAPRASPYAAPEFANFSPSAAYLPIRQPNAQTHDALPRETLHASLAERSPVLFRVLVRSAVVAPPPHR